jgi:hypothetical protein
LPRKQEKTLDKILVDKPEEPLEENSLEEESHIAEPELLPYSPQTSAILIFDPPEKKKILILDFMLDFEDEFFAKYENTSNYNSVGKPQKPKKSSLQKEPLDPSEEAFLKWTLKELVSIISNEWLEESEFSSDVIRLDSPSISIHCQIHKDPFEALYNLVLGVNILLASFSHDLLRHMPLTATTNLLRSPLGHIIPSLEILYVLHIQVKYTMVHLNFYIFDIIEFDLLIGQPIKRLI